MDVETLRTILSIAALCVPVLVFFLGSIKKDVHDVKIDLKQNTDSTQSLAVRMASLDTKQELFGARLEGVAKRTHDMSNDMAVVKSKLGINGSDD